MSNSNFSEISLKSFLAFLRTPLSRTARIYLCFVVAVYITAGAFCAGLYLNVFPFADGVNSYLMAEELLYSMIRSATAAALMVLLIDMSERRNGENA